MNKVKIKLTGPGRGEIFINGEEVKGVFGLNLRAQVGDVNHLTLVLAVSEIEIEAEEVLLLEEKQPC